MTWIIAALSLAISTYTVYCAVQTRRYRLRAEEAADRAARYRRQTEETLRVVRRR